MRGLLDRLRSWTIHAIRTLCRLLILGVTIAGLILILLDGVGKFFTSSEFTVEEITINGNCRVTTEEIQALAAIAPGTNIWLMDLEALGKNLEKHPSIRRATVRRAPPKRIHIDIQERQTIAFYLNKEGSLMGLDAGGVALPPPLSFSANASQDQIKENDVQTLLSYPIVSGKVELPEQPGERIQDPLMLSVLMFLEQVQTETPDFFKEIVEGERQENGNFVLHMRRRIGVLVLRDLQSIDLVKKIKAFWNVLEEKDLRAVYVDGRFPDKGFAVRADDTQKVQWEQMVRPHETI
jgi:hypothetical protein